MAKYRNDDLVDLHGVAEVTGYDYLYLGTLTNGSHEDPLLTRLRIEADETWRAANNSRAHYVYRVRDVRAWANARQARMLVAA